jgi:hypothetical protein
MKGELRNMNNQRLGVFSGSSWVLVIMAILVLGCGRSGSKEETSGVDYNKLVVILPPYNGEDPPPSPGAAALRMLAELEPDVTQLIDGVEAVERSAIQKTLAALEVQFNDGTNPQKPASAVRPTMPDPAAGTAARSPKTVVLSAGMLMFQGQTDSPIGGNRDAALVGLLVSGLSDVLAPYLKESGSVSKSLKETKDGATATMSVEIGRGADGSTQFGLGLKTETNKNGVAAKTELAAKIDGQRCPNAEGQLPFTIKVLLGAESGQAALTREVTANVRAIVNDNATIATSTMDLTQATRQVKDGRSVYIETASTMNYDGTTYSESNFRVIRNSQQATAANARPLSDAGLQAAFAVANTALRNAELVWLDGGCTKIEATSPGTVQPSSATAIPVTVRHTFDGSEVPSKLDAALSGGMSVDPTTLPRTSGTLTYTAPGETGKNATIKLTATSRRGRATLDLTANTGGSAYQIVGGLDDWQTDSRVCDVMRPFTLTGGGFTMQLSGGLSGTYTYSGPFNAQGTGTYTISLPDGVGKAGTMTGRGPGTITGDKIYAGSGTEKYALTPIPPCS